MRVGLPYLSSPGLPPSATLVAFSRGAPMPTNFLSHSPSANAVELRLVPGPLTPQVEPKTHSSTVPPVT
jgi:hypothetical protein